jgi:methionine biosynthesis protein MetW
MSPITAGSPDRNADGLLEAPPDPLRYDHHTRDPAEVGGMIAGFVPRGARVLDVGCGTGALSQLLVETRDAQIVGIEPDPNRAAAARARVMEVLTGTFDDAHVDRLGVFDCVLFADVLEHLADPAATLQRARRILKADGLVIASVPNVAHWSVRWNLLRGQFDYEPCGIMDATHLRWFTERSVRALFAATGYDVEEVGHTVGAWLPPYTRGWPWRVLSVRRARSILMRLRDALPQLFGCQLVVRARRRSITHGGHEHVPGAPGARSPAEEAEGWLAG